MTLYTKCNTQREAIKTTRTMAAVEAKANGCDWTEKVILMSGDTIHITVSEAGRVTTKTTSGWDRDGHIFCGPKAYSVAQ